MEKILILLIVITFSSCSNTDHSINTMIPNCIQNIIDENNSSNELKTLRVQEIDEELHYWLNTDFTHFDGVEFIINSRCDTICSFCGECFLPECSKDYKEKWTVIWEK